MSDREQRTGAHLLQMAKSLGWPDDGEGALEFMLRRAREVAFEDCGADRIEALEFELKAAKSEIEIADSVIEQKHARNEALEAALREIKDQYLTPDQSSAIARAALAPEQDKP